MKINSEINYDFIVFDTPYYVLIREIHTECTYGYCVTLLYIHYSKIFSLNLNKMCKSKNNLANLKENF